MKLTKRAVRVTDVALHADSHLSCSRFADSENNVSHGISLPLRFGRICTVATQHCKTMLVALRILCVAGNSLVGWAATL